MKYSLIGAAIIAGSVMTAAAPANERRTTIPQSGVSTSVTQIRSEDQTSGHYSKPNGGKAIVKKEAYLSGDNKQVSRSVLGAKGSDKKKRTKDISKRAHRVAPRTILTETNDGVDGVESDEGEVDNDNSDSDDNNSDSGDDSNSDGEDNENDG